MSNLYELTSSFKVLEAMAFNGEIDQETFNDTLESLDFEIELKADNYAKLMKNIEADILGFKTEEKRLADKRKALENKIKWLKSSLQNAMIATDKKKFKTDLFSFNIQKNPPKLVLECEDSIPSYYYIEQEPKLDTKALKEALKEGRKVDGATLVQEEGLRIK